MTTVDSNGNVVLPRWFLGFLSVIVTVLTIAVLPWTSSVTENLRLLTRESSALAARFDGQVQLQSEVIRDINRRIERLEAKLDRLESHGAGRP